MSDVVDALLERLEHVKRRGAGWQARCPAHEDRHPSLSIGVGDDGRALVKCHAGCTVDAVLAALGLESRDLFPQDHRHDGAIVDAFPYHDADGRLLFEAVRFEPKDFALRRPNGAGGWVWNLGRTPRQVYRLPEVREAVAARERAVWITEGEKHADLLRRRGRVATTNPMGAGKWNQPAYADALAGAARVIVLADDDTPGRDHADEVARSLAGRVGELKVVELYPRGESKRDVVDFYADADTPEDADRQLAALVEQAPVYTAAAGPALGVEFVTVEEFVAHPVPQAEPIVVDANGSTVIAASGFGLTYGDGGAGKTTLWLDGGLHFAAGDPWLGGLLAPTRPLRVGWVENEGPQEEFRRKLERKLEAWRERLPPGRFHVLRAPWGALDLRLVEHRDGLAAAVRELELDLLIVGPLNDLGMEGGGTPDQVRDFHGRLKDVQNLAGRLVSLMVLHHENTAGRVSGAWTGRPDLLVHVTEQGNGRTRVLWQKAKWSSSLHRTTSQLRWLEHEGFELAEPEADRPERTWEGIEAYVLAHGGTGWNDVAKAVAGEAKYLQRRRDAMLADGLLVNAGTAHSFNLWHRDDPARPTLDANGSAAVRTSEPMSDSDGSEPSEPPDSPTEGEGEIESGSAVRVRSSEPLPNRLDSEPSDRSGAGDPEDDE
jgi:AAA domain